MPWPTYPMIYRVSSAHEEGGERVYAVNTECFLGDDEGNLRALRAHKVEQTFVDGRMTFERVDGTDFERSEERRVGKECRSPSSKRDWSSDVCSSDLDALADVSDDLSRVVRTRRGRRARVRGEHGVLPRRRRRQSACVTRAQGRADIR